VVVQDCLLIGTGPFAEWTGWTDRLVQAEFDWRLTSTWGPTTYVIANGTPVSGLVVERIAPTTTEGAQLGIRFDELPPGTAVWISRRLIYTGSVPFAGTIDVASFPTPEPRTSSLLALGGVVLLGRGHRSANSCFDSRMGQRTAAMGPFHREESV
jgi:hypothetical protein